MVREQGRSVAAAAHDLNTSVRSETRCWAIFLDTGSEYHYDPAMWNCHSENRMDDPQLRDAVLSTVEEQPELFLDESSDAVSEMDAQVDEAVVVSPARAARVLTRSGSTRKVTERASIARNEANRAARVAAQWKIPLGCRIHVDEAHRV